MLDPHCICMCLTLTMRYLIFIRRGSLDVAWIAGVITFYFLQPLQWKKILSFFFFFFFSDKKLLLNVLDKSSLSSSNATW